MLFAIITKSSGEVLAITYPIVSSLSHISNAFNSKLFKISNPTGIRSPEITELEKIGLLFVKSSIKFDRLYFHMAL